MSQRKRSSANERKGERSDRKRPLRISEDDEVERKKGKNVSQTYGDSLVVSGSKAKRSKRRQKASLKRVENAPETCPKQGSDRKRSREPCDAEEVALKKAKDQEEAKTSGKGLPAAKTKSPQQRYKERVEKLYKRGKLLGRGGFGSVYAGTRISDGLQVALKYAEKLEDDELQLPGQAEPMPREVSLMMAVNETPNPNILNMYDWFDRPYSYVMVLERPDPCQDLETYCLEQGGVLNEEQARAVTEQLLPALQHCQEKGIVHRDVKPENLLIQTDTKEIKLIDFGCGDLLKDTPYDDFSGTLCYQPLEWFQDEKYLAGPGTVWSVGVTLFNLVCGHLPFKRYNTAAMSQVKFTKGLSPEIRDFMQWCLKPNPEDRPTLEELRRHPWLHPHS